MSVHNSNLVVQVHQNPYAKPRVYVGSEQIPVEKLESVRSENRVNADGSLATFVTLEFAVDKLEILTETPADTVRNQIQAAINYKD